MTVVVEEEFVKKKSENCFKFCKKNNKKIRKPRKIFFNFIDNRQADYR